ncbi:class I adenylate-forming enzyme family protein [Marinactinospora thermotolerans]|uniref:Acyl-CoA synthetase (AMP-forming)/AMP-acid ligase II n=1 Tax=Marinactinospora thermotolerans DSM 45154 TaxID=1122192 RepID=A0A1T4NC66_9ACTN|nr:class I adenylate-forming enzyme family protein [Marinactinospora thermotolerans]SJZ76824.1 Acyl-CoA synthetase (AMP-forming)/AMP-acid ligase II [Marinactinospora thermotolerans DSM 45154]
MSQSSLPPPPRSLASVTAQLLTTGTPFETERVEIGGVPTRVWKKAPPHLRAILETSLEHGDRPALVLDEQRISHTEYYRRAAALAHRLVTDHGVAKGDRVAIAMRNRPEWVVSFFAAASIGAIVVPLNAWWVGRELEFGLRDSGAKVLIADGERLDRLADLSTPPATIAVDVGRRLPPGARTWEQTLGHPAPDVRLPEVELHPDDPVTIFYTSGTTGLPKGALGSHRNLVSNIVSGAYARARALMRAGVDLDDVLTLAEQLPPPVILCAVPLFHATGAQSVMLPTLFTGGTLVLVHKWDADAAPALIERERVTGMTGVPTMLTQLLASPRLAEHDVSSLVMLNSGGAPAAPAIVSRARASLHDLLLGVGYGLTECSAIATSNMGPDYLLRPDSVGAPVAVVDVRVSGPDGTELPPGEVGEVWLRGPGVVHGYWKRPEATAQAITDGWLRTGDLGRLDEEGFLYIVDRAKDMIIRGGENVYCAEVEAAIHEHPAVAEVAVVGVPHDVLGEEVGALVRVLPGVPLDVDDLRAHLRERIAAFKIPTHITLTTGELPRNAAGKLLKKQVRDRLRPRSG